MVQNLALAFVKIDYFFYLGKTLSDILAGFVKYEINLTIKKSVNMTEKTSADDKLIVFAYSHCTKTNTPLIPDTVAVTTDIFTAIFTPVEQTEVVTSVNLVLVVASL